MINKRLAQVGLLMVIALSAPVISANSIVESKQQPDSSSSPLVESIPKESTAAAQKQPETLVEAKKIDPQPAVAAAPKHQVEEKLADTTSLELNGKRQAKSTESESSSSSSSSSTGEQKPAAEEKVTAAEPAKAKPDSAPTKPPSASKAASQKQSSLSGKSGTSKSKLPANLGTVTSTGSGGATHYMSKHDAYSAIAEKHGALAHDAMRKSDKRHLHSSGGNPFSGSIQKASGIGEMLNPFKGVTDSGLARTLGASMRSIMKSKYSVPAYVASALLGAVALMAFYESPISPLPVPALPNPPVGRFPPEMPNISPNFQAPFRQSQQQQWSQQQQNYNQRSLSAQQQPQQQVFFPGNGPQQQQQSLAANLLASVGKQAQVAQRKSAPDYDPSTSRSLFGNNSPFAAPQKQANHQQRQSNAILSFFGLSGGATDSSQTSSSSLEPKGGQQGSQTAAAAGVLSNSHVVNKVKSYFRAPSPAGSSSAAGISNSNPYDQYQRMSLVQALMKDTAFLPGFLSPGNRKSSPPALVSAAAKQPESAAAAANQPQVSAAARMQVGTEGQLQKQPQQQQQQTKSSSSSYGIVKVANALLESLGSGIAQRSSQPSERKSNSDEHQSIAAATSLLSDLVSGYNTNVDQQQQVSQQQQQAQQQPAPDQQASGAHQPQAQQQHQQQQPSPQAQARSDDEPTIITADDQMFSAKKTDEKPAALSRKTRSIGLEYPVEALTENHPSRAAQINNVIDFVADSYAHNKILFNFVMNQVGLSQAVPYVEQILAPTTTKDSQ